MSKIKEDVKREIERQGLIYDPSIHCCIYWYKDFCTCVKEDLAERKARSNQRNTNGTESFLKKNKIEYSYTTTYNVVLIETAESKIYLSLKKDGSLLKVRFAGAAKWYTFSKDKFLLKFKNK